MDLLTDFLTDSHRKNHDDRGGGRPVKTFVEVEDALMFSEVDGE